MKLCTKLLTVCLALAWLSATSAPSNAAGYEGIFGRHSAGPHGETRARLTVDLLVLGREGGVQPIDILFSTPAGGPSTPLLNTTDVDLGASLSGRYDLIVTDSSPYELQFTRTGFPSGHKSDETRTDPDLSASFFALSVNTALFSDPTALSNTFTVKYDSKFGSGEVNLRKRIGPASPCLQDSDISLCKRTLISSACKRPIPSLPLVRIPITRCTVFSLERKAPFGRTVVPGSMWSGVAAPF